MKFRHLLFISAAATIGLASCKSASTSAPSPVTTQGTAVAVGNGTATSYLTTLDGVPTSVGLELSASALTGLPAGPDPGVYMVMMPGNMPSTVPFKYVGFYWNPGGHPPAGIYTAPHFDMHFFTKDMAEIEKIGFGKDSVAVPSENIPAGYFNPDSLVVPMMGVHWVDPSSPEFHGAAFSRTFIYGFYRGSLTFMEPMITKAYLETHASESIAIPQPAKFATAGYYPKSYAIKFDTTANVWRISLEGMTLHP